MAIVRIVIPLYAYCLSIICSETGNHFSGSCLSGRVHLQHAAPDLICLNRFEQRLEVALAEPVVTLALDELEENGSDRVGREQLQQDLGLAARHHPFPVNQNAKLAQPPQRLAITRQSSLDF